MNAHSTTTSGSPSRVPPQRRSWWRTFFGFPEPVVVVSPQPPPAPVSVSYRQDVPQPLLVPAKGDAFDFRVHPVYLWTGRRMTFEELKYRAERYLDWAGGIVRERIIDVSREFEPHRSHELERVLNQRLAGQRWPADESLPQFSAYVRISPDERVRDQLRPYWQERIRLECDHELQKIRTRNVDDLTRRWCAVLQALEADPVTAHAARLTGEQFAEVFRRYVDERRGTVPELVTLLREAVRGHHDLNLGPSEYTEAWDVALRAYEREHGLAPR
ncbi:hypothetical protein [Micromonospora sp. WMMD987]|jgi:hypothetical protein|uniref:hypothetical protein n=1 Tax=Micromonospora TaxID=1873 RepID=UPI00249AD179|nr:hypothetical protein [Micromonospora sp. WMMD987]WFE93614.1 hypothetical protein O7612_19650 [Micromonospora sp. WMMD987]